MKDSPYIRYINRWHLEKAEPLFEKSKPKKPIVYWIENTVPVEYREAVREGILLWNNAFEKLGLEEQQIVTQSLQELRMSYVSAAGKTPEEELTDESSDDEEISTSAKNPSVPPVVVSERFSPPLPATPCECAVDAH